MFTTILKSRDKQPYLSRTIPTEELHIFSDGAVRERPAAASAATVVKDANGQVMQWQSRLLPSMSSCEAEYNGLFAALEVARQLQPHRAYFYLDSQVVAGQVTGKFAVRQSYLKPLHRQALTSIEQLQTAGCTKIEFYFIPREYNLLADALAADALIILPKNRMLNMRQFNTAGEISPHHRSDDLPILSGSAADADDDD